MKNTNPLAKSIFTGEGILVYATNVLLAVAAVLPHGLSWTKTGLYIGILNAVHVIARSLLKAVAIQKGLGLGEPIQFDPVDPAVIASVVAEGVGGVTATADGPATPEVSTKPQTAVTPDGP